jgi:hypothetical protein
MRLSDEEAIRRLLEQRGFPNPSELLIQRNVRLLRRRRLFVRLGLAFCLVWLVLAIVYEVVRLSRVPT